MEKSALSAFPDEVMKFSKLLVILRKDIYSHLLKKNIESGIYVWILSLIYGEHNLTFVEGQYINNFRLDKKLICIFFA